jgi:pantoate--beta-alanine ligase
MSVTAPICTIEAMRAVVATARQNKRSIGLVPTMGALHAGHASLIRAARAETALVVVSIFVNPIQFGPGEDFSRYPRPLDKDLELCAREGVDAVFAPLPETMYSNHFRTFVHVSELDEPLCGAARPGHFRGVATVVLKLFNIVQPDTAYFGQKDVQQVRIIQQLVRDLDVPVEVRVCPTVREPDGLALSSRNQYLDPIQRHHSTVLFGALQEAQSMILTGERNPAAIQQVLESRIRAVPDAFLDYAAVVSADSLQPLDRLRGEVLLALAVKFGSTRLIDNIVVSTVDG